MRRPWSVLTLTFTFPVGGTSIRATCARRAGRRGRCLRELIFLRRRSLRVRDIFTPWQDGGVPAPRAASCWLGVPSAPEVQVARAHLLGTWPGTTAARPPVGYIVLPGPRSSSTPGWQLEAHRGRLVGLCGVGCCAPQCFHYPYVFLFITACATLCGCSSQSVRNSWGLASYTRSVRHSHSYSSVGLCTVVWSSDE